ncbi:hypothetical protein ACFSLT_03830 [Novosphingobium resinovorum]
MLTICLLWWLVHQHNARVIERHEEKRETAANHARERSAEERADDAVQNIIADHARETEIAKAAASEAVKGPKQRATLPPTSVALNCQRMRQAYPKSDLAKIPAYQKRCQG